MGVVEVRSDQEYAGRPRALQWEGRRLAVIVLLQSWRTPQGKHFLVRTDDDLIFELTYLEAADDWIITPRPGAM